jgi:rod shape-determining protein MreD
VTAIDALKAAGLVLLATIVQISLVEWIEIGEAHPDVVLVTLVAVSLLRGPTYGAVLGFLAGLVIDTASFGTFGLTSLLLTVIGYWTGRFGEATTRSSAHPLLIAVILASAGFTLGSAVLHFMLGDSIPASQLFLAVLLPGLAFNLIFAYPVYALCARILPPRLIVRREAKPAV